MKIKVLFCTILTLALLATQPLYAQVKKKSKKSKEEETTEYFDESGGLKHRLWYGGGINLGGQISSNSSLFVFGLSPMVGYKILDNLSVGPRVAFDVNSLKIADGGKIYRAAPISWSAGSFVRYKFLNFLFVHGELGYRTDRSYYDNNGNIYVNPNDPSKLQIFTTGYMSQILGLGYTSGAPGGVGYEIGLYYDFGKNTANSVAQPIDFRIGFNYNF
ncbi:MAG: hypothetical protein KA974_02350 [Saprospiraceae bacterium]|nr:hypothetical protein [Saprospiraceae bacterium]MBP7679654.1 hypothetical protein [Saprospiraceae bacterium]